MVDKYILLSYKVIYSTYTRTLNVSRSGETGRNWHGFKETIK